MNMMVRKVLKKNIGAGEMTGNAILAACTIGAIFLFCNGLPVHALLAFVVGIYLNDKYNSGYYCKQSDKKELKK